MSLREPNNKITFANQLRGLAVLSVIVAHYCGVYWFSRDIVSMYIRAPLAEGSPPGIIYYIGFPTFNYGPFGVGVFFLISGFVIPFSLEKLGSWKFLLARSFRIFPTYWAAVTVTTLLVAASGGYWARPSIFSDVQILMNGFLVQQFTNTPSIDMVNWTLAIEILFYLCSAAMWPFLRRASSTALINFAVIVLALLNWWPASWDIPVSYEQTVYTWGSIKYELMMVSFIFIGTLFNFKMREQISTGRMIGSVSAIFVAFLMMWQKTPFADQFWRGTINYGYALIVFSVCFYFRRKFRPSKILDFFADISYPLYLVHAVCGYAVIRFLMEHRFSSSAAMVVAFCVAVVVAYVLHVTIEIPTSSLIKKREKPETLKENVA